MSDLTPTQPTSVWHRPIKVDFRKLFSAVGRLAVDAGTGSWSGAIKDGIGIVDLLGLGQSPEEVAGLLKFVNMQGHVAETIAARVPSRFVYALHRECVERPGDYAKLFAALEGRFSEAWRRERSWEEYRHWLESSLDDSVFGEDFGLRQIFLWPRAWFGQRVETRERGRGERSHGDETRHVVELREHLDQWMASPTEGHDAVRVLSGEPGAGKSSFTRMYAAHRVSMGDHVLLVPLHMLNVAHDLREALISLCEATPPFPKAPFTGDERLLLILDGLDELSKQGSSGARLAHEFAQHVQQLVNARNLGGERLRVILSGRPIAIGELDTVFRATGQLLHLLPYAVRETNWDDPDKLLAVDQRHIWWQRYGALTDQSYERLPEALSGDSLFETTRQPLLGYLLALVYRDAVTRGQSIASYPGSTPPFGEMEEMALAAVTAPDQNFCPCCWSPICTAALSKEIASGVRREPMSFREFYNLDETDAAGNLTPKAVSRRAALASKPCAGGSCPNAGKAEPKSDPPCDVYRVLTKEEADDNFNGIDAEQKRDLRKAKGLPQSKDELAKQEIGSAFAKAADLRKAGWSDEAMEEAIQIDHTTPRRAGGCPTSASNTTAHPHKCSNCKSVDADLDRWNGLELTERRAALGISKR